MLNALGLLSAARLLSQQHPFVDYFEFRALLLFPDGSEARALVGRQCLVLAPLKLVLVESVLALVLLCSGPAIEQKF